MLGFVQMPGGVEWVVILIIALLLFGPRLPSVMRALGKSVSEFKKGMREGENELKAYDKGNREGTSGGTPSGPAG